MSSGGEAREIGHEVADEGAGGAAELGAVEGGGGAHPVGAEAAGGEDGAFEHEQRLALGTGSDVLVRPAVARRVGASAIVASQSEREARTPSRGLDLPVEAGEGLAVARVGRRLRHDEAAVGAALEAGGELVEVGGELDVGEPAHVALEEKVEAEGGERQRDEHRRAAGGDEPQAQRGALHRSAGSRK